VTCDRDSNERGVIWNALYRESPKATASSCDSSTALAVGTTVKLARALWIVPLWLVTAVALKSRARVRRPWFILLNVFEICN